MAEIVIPVYGQAEHLARLLPLLEGHRPILVDDASPDSETRALVRERARRSDTRAVLLEKNRGFPAAVNAGAEQVEGESFFLLNSDVLPHPSWDAAMQARLGRHPKAAAIGARLLFPDGVTVQHAGVDFRAEDGVPVHIHRYFSREADEVARARELAMVTHAAVLVRTGAFRAAGGYDEGYGFGMYEDCDLSLRLREQGWVSIYEPAAELLHEESASFGARPDLMPIKLHGEQRFLETWIWSGRYRGLELNREID